MIPHHIDVLLGSERDGIHRVLRSKLHCMTWYSTLFNGVLQCVHERMTILAYHMLLNNWLHSFHLSWVPLFDCFSWSFLDILPHCLFSEGGNLQKSCSLSFCLPSKLLFAPKAWMVSPQALPCKCGFCGQMAIPVWQPTLTKHRYCKTYLKYLYLLFFLV